MHSLKAPDVVNKQIIIVYKHSRYAHGLMLAKDQPGSLLHNADDPLTKRLKLSHDRNLASLAEVEKSVKKLGVKYFIKCRSDISDVDLRGRLVISVGGDGTLLDISHHCSDSPILGVNSDPESSIGALCAVRPDELDQMLSEIFSRKILPSPISRLDISSGGKHSKFFALNDVLFCSKNPAAMARFSIRLGANSEIHHNSGLWVSSAAGSSGAIFSAGGECMPIEALKAQFLMREPYWCDQAVPKLISGRFANPDVLKITSRMEDACAFIDGPHKGLELALGEELQIKIADLPLWLFEQNRLNANRKKIIAQRTKMRGALSTC